MTGIQDDPGRIWIDRRLRVAGGEQLPGETRLPELEDTGFVHDPKVDALGRLIGMNPLLLGGAGAAGFALGVTRPGGGIIRHVGRGLLGAGAALVAGLAVAKVVDVVSGRSRSDSDAYVRQVPGATSEPARGERGEHLRVMDWNVRELIGQDGHGQIRKGDAAIDAIAETVEREHPDVLVLQEVSQFSPIGGFGDDLEELKRRTGATDAVLLPNGMRGLGKAKGNAVLTFGGARIEDARGLRHPDPEGSGVIRRIRGAASPLESVGVDLPDWMLPTYHPRTTGDLIVRTAGGNDVRVLDVHLSGTGGAATGGTPGSTMGQMRQLTPLTATFDAWKGPTILTGDFNVKGGTTEHRYEVEILRANGLLDAATELGTDPGDDSLDSFPASNPTRGIDRLYHSSGLTPQRLRVLNDDATAQVGSDHVPLVADLVVE